MQAKNIGPLLAVLALTALGAAAQAAPAQAAPQTMLRTVTVKTTAPQAAVIIKLGAAMLEEYTGANPDERTTIYRDSESAQKPVTTKAKPQS